MPWIRTATLCRTITMECTKSVASFSILRLPEFVLMQFDDDQSSYTRLVFITFRVISFLTLFFISLLLFQLVCRSWRFSCGAIHTNEDFFVMTNRWCIHSMIQPSEIGCCTSLGLFYPLVWWVRTEKRIKFHILKFGLEPSNCDSTRRLRMSKRWYARVANQQWAAFFFQWLRQTKTIIYLSNRSCSDFKFYGGSSICGQWNFWISFSLLPQN